MRDLVAERQRVCERCVWWTSLGTPTDVNLCRDKEVCDNNRAEWPTKEYGGLHRVLGWYYPAWFNVNDSQDDSQ